MFGTRDDRPDRVTLSRDAIAINDIELDKLRIESDGGVCSCEVNIYDKILTQAQHTLRPHIAFAFRDV